MFIMMGKGGGRRVQEGLVGGLDDMSPYFKSRITNALACAPPYECILDGDCGVDMFRSLVLVASFRQMILLEAKELLTLLFCVKG